MTNTLAQQIDAIINKHHSVDALSDSAVDWIRDAIVLLESAADTIEHLTAKQEELAREAQAWRWIVDTTYPTWHKYVPHPCEEELQPWERRNTPGDEDPEPCYACQIKRVTEYVYDHEELPWWAPNVDTFLRSIP